MRKIELRPLEAVKRMGSAAVVTVVGPSSAGKSTLVYTLVNEKVAAFMRDGIGDKNRTTIIPCTFLFDERLREDEFALRIRRQSFAAKDIHMECMEQLAVLFANMGADAQDTLDSIDDVWFRRVLEPESAAYHLGKMKELSADKLTDALRPVLEALEHAEIPFDQQVAAKKAELKAQKIKITQIRRMVFADMWERLPAEITQSYFQWIDAVGEQIEQQLKELIGSGAGSSSVLEYSTQENGGSYPYGGRVLTQLFDPYQPYSLIVNEMTVACMPRKEILNAKTEQKLPVQFCLKDTMGLNQMETDTDSIRDALDLALKSSPDSILLLINLEERDDVIAKSCSAVADKLRRMERMDIPVHVFFTKADRILENIINKKEESALILTQEDYDRNMPQALEKMEAAIGTYLEAMPHNSAAWISLRYKEKEIDPVQTALHKCRPDQAARFMPAGLYQNIENIVKDAQSRSLPEEIRSQLIVPIKDYDKPAVAFLVDRTKIQSILYNICVKLTKDKATVNRYLITTPYQIHGRSVVNYYWKLRNGQGYKTNAKVYGNFNINMKQMLYNVLCEYIISFENLYANQAVVTVTDNLEEDGIHEIIQKLDAEGKLCASVRAGFHPLVWENLPEKDRYAQILHNIFRNYFERTNKFYSIMNQTASQLSYNNDYVCQIIDGIYRLPISYDATIRRMQDSFRDIFGSDKFLELIVEEIGRAMTQQADKMFYVC